MRAAIYNPYLDTLGGGELYTISVAKVLAENGYDVDIQWKNHHILKKLEDRFGLNLQGISTVKNINRGDNYDVCFWVSDGSIPMLRARNNILHFQIPFRNVQGRTLINKMKLFRVRHIVCNSKFTKKFIDLEYRVSSRVIYPPVNVSLFKPKRKENIILYVGRFSKLTQAKRQDVLIEMFKKLYKENNDWKLILAGGAEIGVGNFIKQLKEKSANYPIEIISSPSFDRVKELYGKSKIFWSASGYNIDESKNPKKVEHFGITVVEAMASGTVPVISNIGGHKEIITDNNNGFLWNTKKDCLSKTQKLIDNPKLLREISKVSKNESEKYNYEVFKNNFTKLL